MTELALLLTGLAMLVGGARLLVDHAVRLAQHYHLSEFVVGIVILAMGSDLPELFVALSAAIKAAGGGAELSGLILGTSIGSCFGQLGLIMGLVGLMGYLTMPRNYIYHHGAFLVGGLMFLFLTGQDGVISAPEGGILVVAFVVYLFTLSGQARIAGESATVPAGTPWRTWSFIAGGLLLVLLGSELTVNSAVALADVLGIKQSLVAILFIGVATSLPELSISMAAMIKTRHAMSVGNLVGSNIFDTFVPVGMAAMIAPLRFDAALLWYDIPALLFLTLLVLVFFSIRKGLQRREAAVLLALYGAYVLFKLLTASVEAAT